MQFCYRLNFYHTVFINLLSIYSNYKRNLSNVFVFKLRDLSFYIIHAILLYFFESFEYANVQNFKNPMIL
jgi:hypothetical protein